MKNLVTCIRIMAGLIFIIMSNSTLAEEVRIASAANFTATMKDLIVLFEKSTGHKTRVSYGSTGKLYTQIENGAPFDIFFAADSKRPLRAESNGLAVKGSSFIYAFGKLVLCSNSLDLSKTGEAWLKKVSSKKLAMANDKTAPYGEAAKQTLQHLGIWQNNQHKIVRGDSIAQTFQFVATNNTKAGFVALSQANNWPTMKGKCWRIPTAYYSPLKQSAVLLKSGSANTAALTFIDFIKQQPAKNIIAAHGYDI